MQAAIIGGPVLQAASGQHVLIAQHHQLLHQQRHGIAHVRPLAAPGIRRIQGERITRLQHHHAALPGHGPQLYLILRHGQRRCAHDFRIDAFQLAVLDIRVRRIVVVAIQHDRLRRLRQATDGEGQA
ncbi:hypothetical protein D3C72_1846090 [compost metagenome]